jgi:putative transposase
MRDIESLCERAGLGKLSKTTAQRICTELRERFEQFKRRDLYNVQLAALFLDAVFLSVRPNGPKEGVLVAWGFTEQGERVLLSVMLGMRESHEDWLALGRDLIARGLGAPLLIVADGAPGLIKAVEQCWPASDRQHCAVHRLRNLLAKLPERERERIRAAYWQALDDAADERDGKQRLQGLVDELDGAGYTAAAKCLADDLDALVIHLRYPTRHRRRWRSTDESVKGRTPSGARFRATDRSRHRLGRPEIGSCGLVFGRRRRDRPISGWVGPAARDGVHRRAIRIAVVGDQALDGDPVAGEVLDGAA